MSAFPTNAIEFDSNSYDDFFTVAGERFPRSDDIMRRAVDILHTPGFIHPVLTPESSTLAIKMAASEWLDANLSAHHRMRLISAAQRREGVE